MEGPSTHAASLLAALSSKRELSCVRSLGVYAGLAFLSKTHVMCGEAPMCALILLLLGTAGPAADENQTSPDRRQSEDVTGGTLEILDRVVMADIQLLPRPFGPPHLKRPLARWRVRYDLRYVGDQPLSVDPETARWTLRGWLSNSRIPSHGHPRFVEASGNLRGTARTPVLRGGGGFVTCSDVVRVSLGSLPEETNVPSVILPGERFRCWATLMHDHRVWSGFDVLLGDREFSMHLGDIRAPADPSSTRPARFRDTLPLSEAPELPKVIAEFLPIRPEWRQKQETDAPEDTLVLQTPPSQFVRYHFDGLLVRPDTPYCLRFSLCTARGSDGPCRLAVNEFDDYNNMLRNKEYVLPFSDAWQTFEVVIRTSDGSETISLVFALWYASSATAWIRDIKLIPLDEQPEHP